MKNPTTNRDEAARNYADTKGLRYERAVRRAVNALKEASTALYRLEQSAETNGRTPRGWAEFYEVKAIEKELAKFLKAEVTR